MKLPNGHRADLDLKLEEYSLNPFHREGRHKARVFKSALAITLENKEVLEEAVRHVAEHSWDAIDRGDNGFGRTYVLKFSLTTDQGTAIVLSGWIVRHGEDFPRLTTCYIL